MTGVRNPLGDSALGDRESAWSDQEALDFSPEELSEFLAGDLFPSDADPAFKEELRQKLWTMLLSRASRRRSDA